MQKLSRRVVSQRLINGAAAFYLACFGWQRRAAFAATEELEKRLYASFLEKRYYDVVVTGTDLFSKGALQRSNEYAFDVFIDALIYTGRFELAQQRLDQKFEYINRTYKETEQLGVLGKALVQNGDLYRIRRRVQDALNMYQTAIKKIQTAFGGISDNLSESISEMPKLYIRACNGLAIIELEQGQLQRAKMMFRRSVQIAINRPNMMDKMLGAENDLVAVTYLGLARGLFSLKQYQDAEEILQEALKLLEMSNARGQAFVSEYHLELGDVLAARENYSAAIYSYNKAIELSSKEHLSYGAILVGALLALSRVGRRKGEIDDSIMRKAYKKAVEIFGDGSAITARVKLEWAENSFSYLKQAAPTEITAIIDIFRQTFSEDADEVTRARLVLARYFVERREFGEASKALEKIPLKSAARFTYFLDILSEIPSLEDSFAVSFKIAQLSQVSDASKSFFEFVARSSVVELDGKELIRIFQDQKNLVDLLLQHMRAFGVRRSASTRDTEEFSRISDALSREEFKLAELEHTLTVRFPKYFDIQGATVIQHEEIQLLLDEDEALVVLKTGADHDAQYTWILTRERSAWKKAKIGREAMERLVKNLLGALKEEGRTGNDFASAYTICQNTFGGLDNLCVNKRHLIFVLDSDLTSLPPQVFVLENPQDKMLHQVEWLVKRYAVTILPSVPSLTMLRTMRGGVKAPKVIRGYADITYSPDNAATEKIISMRSLGEYFNQGIADYQALKSAPLLPATGPELRAVVAALGGDEKEMITGRSASEADVKNSQLSNFRVLYFATHGLLSGKVEGLARINAEPALLLAVPETPTAEDNGLLTASEIVKLKLNADWVVLSACNTAAGGKPGAEALSGLASAFFYAGARALLVSHWPVDDLATQALMVRLFETVKGNPHQRAAEAQRVATLSVMNDAKFPQWANPVYWAPFVLVGEPRM